MDRQLGGITAEDDADSGLVMQVLSGAIMGSPPDPGDISVLDLALHGFGVHTWWSRSADRMGRCCSRVGRRSSRSPASCTASPGSAWTCWTGSPPSKFGPGLDLGRRLAVVLQAVPAPDDDPFLGAVIARLTSTDPLALALADRRVGHDRRTRCPGPRDGDPGELGGHRRRPGMDGDPSPVPHTGS